MQDGSFVRGETSEMLVCHLPRHRRICYSLIFPPIRPGVMSCPHGVYCRDLCGGERRAAFPREHIMRGNHARDLLREDTPISFFKGFPARKVDFHR